MRFLIIGCGEMGKRRARCLRHLGYDDIAAYDERDERRSAIASELGIPTFPRFKDALREGADLAIICTPPDQHEDCALRSIDARMPVFCEAPVALTLECVDRIIDAAEASGLFLAGSSTLLHSRVHRAVKSLLDNAELGRPLCSVSFVGQHLADRHSNEDYRDAYVSKRSEGGMGFDLLPLELQLNSYLFGDPRSLSCMARSRGGALVSEGGANDVHDITLDMAGDVSLMLHVDVLQRPATELRRIACERGAIEWSSRHLRVARFMESTPDAVTWDDITPADADPDQMYTDELAHVIRCLQGSDTMLVSPRRQRQILSWILACEESSATGSHIHFA